MTRRRPASRARRDAGASLILVVWAVGLMAALAALVSRDAHLDTLEGHMTRETFRAGVLADAGFALALDHLDHQTSAFTVSFPKSCTMETGRLFLDVRPASALIDLNAGSEDLLAALLETLGANPAVARQSAASIADFRDGDETARPGGAELADYIRAGREYGPADRPFERVGELSEVLDIPPALVTAALPHLTVHSLQHAVNTDWASPEVLAAVALAKGPGETSMRSGDPFEARDVTAASFAGQAVIVSVVANSEGGGWHARSATFGTLRGQGGTRRLMEEHIVSPGLMAHARAAAPAGPCF